MAIKLTMIILCSGFVFASIAQRSQADVDDRVRTNELQDAVQEQQLQQMNKTTADHEQRMREVEGKLNQALGMWKLVLLIGLAEVAQLLVGASKWLSSFKQLAAANRSAARADVSTKSEGVGSGQD
jgi:uncharacterized coiled-coil protein SlyX